MGSDMPIWSKPKLPLGCERIQGKRRVVLYEPWESEPLAVCMICREPVRPSEFIELSQCLHHGCKGCLLQYAAHRWMAGERFACPLCRSTQANGCAELQNDGDVDGLVRRGTHRLYYLQDCFQNWHCYGVQHQLERYVVRALNSAKTARRLLAYTKSQLCWLSPYHGWIVPNGSPARNPRFRVLDSKTLQGTSY